MVIHVATCIYRLAKHTNFQSGNCTNLPMHMTKQCRVIVVLVCYDLIYSLLTFSWPWFESGSLRNGGMLAIRIFAGSIMSRKYCATSESLHVFYRVFAARRSCLLPSALAMLGRGKRPNTTAKIIIYNVYQYFQKETAKSKYRGALKLTSRTAETTWYSERMYIEEL